MRRVFYTSVVAALLTSGAAQARDITVIQFLERFITDPATAFDGPAPPKRKVKAAETPLLSVPLPHLRPSDASSSALGYQADDTPAVAAIDDMPTPRLRPDDLLPTLSGNPGPAIATAPPAADGPGNAALTTALEAAAARQRAAAAPADAPSAAVAPSSIASASPAKPETSDSSSAKQTVGPLLASLAPVPLPTVRPRTALVRPPPAANSACGVALAQLGVTATPLAPMEDGDCGIDAPVAVSALDNGRVSVSPKAIIDCHLAEQLANWVKDTVQPGVRKDYSGELTGLRVAASYACRTRDSLPDAKLSEHAHGNAIDIAAFRVDERWIEVGPGWKGGGEDAAFLAETRKSACGPFTTVLGPGSDSFHTDHFHLDMIQRRTAGPSRGLYCK